MQSPDTLSITSDRAGEMAYRKKLDNGVDDTLLNLLSSNAQNNYRYKNKQRAHEGLRPLLMQSFMAAAGI